MFPCPGFLDGTVRKRLEELCREFDILLIIDDILREGLQIVRDSLTALVEKQRKMITGEQS